MQAVSNISVARGGGNIGQLIVEQLLQGGFNVSVLTRPGSKANFDPNVPRMHYGLFNSLTAYCLQGQDAIVSAICDTSSPTTKDTHRCGCRGRSQTILAERIRYRCLPAGTLPINATCDPPEEQNRAVSQDERGAWPHLDRHMRRCLV